MSQICCLEQNCPRIRINVDGRHAMARTQRGSAQLVSWMNQPWNCCILQHETLSPSLPTLQQKHSTIFWWFLETKSNLSLAARSLEFNRRRAYVSLALICTPSIIFTQVFFTMSRSFSSPIASFQGAPGTSFNTIQLFLLWSYSSLLIIFQLYST